MICKSRTFGHCRRQPLLLDSCSSLTKQCSYAFCNPSRSHGSCDLVMLTNPSFDNGKGMEVHIRTKIEAFYSYISAAAIRIGDDIFEVQGGSVEHTYWLNGVHEAPLPASLSGHPVDHYVEKKQKRKTRKFGFEIVIGKRGEKIRIEYYKHFVSIFFREATEQNFGSSAGLFGSYQTGLKLARDGFTVMENASEFGMEWQVRGDDPKLFHNVSGGVVQYPERCQLPTTTAEESRRLRVDGVTNEQAHETCALVDPEDYDDCVFDVIALDDLGTCVFISCFHSFS